MLNVTYQDYREKVGKEIERARAAKDLSRDALSIKIGLNENNKPKVCSKTINRIETGDYPRDVGLYSLQEVCKALGVKLSMKIGGC
jgi:ribosome-binding protein aMBF1 (putative translation factor)